MNPRFPRILTMASLAIGRGSKFVECLPPDQLNENNQSMFQGVSESHSDLTAINKTAGAMLVRDWKFIALAYPLIVVAPLLASNLGSGNTALPLFVAVLERFGQLAFIFLASKRWIEIFSSRSVSKKNTINFFAIGMAIWLLFAVPLTLQIMNIPGAAKLVTLPLLGAALWFTLAFFFYPAPVLLSATMKDALIYARTITAEDKWLAAKILLIPMGVVSILTAVTYLPWPDGRSQSLVLLGEILSGTFTVLACYLSLSVFFCKAPGNVRQALGLDPYLEDRLATIQAQDQLGLGKYLAPRRGVQFLLISIALWGINIARLMELPPSAAIKIETISITGNQISINAIATDEQYNFRGFHPFYLALAGETRTVIAEQPKKLEIFKDGAFVPAGFTVSSDSPSARLRITYEANRAGKELAALEDLHLWYRGVKLEKLAMKDATLIEPEQQIPNSK